MVLVNNPGAWRAVYPPLRHAAWHGWTPTDVIFPFFVFIVGVAIPLALGPRLERDGRAAVTLKVVRRSIVIFALGIVLNGFPWFVWATLRIPGIALGELWGLWFPINKSLWTSSYVILTGGLALVALAAFYWLIEIRERRRWAIPFAVLGVNALVLFFLSTLAARLLSIVKV